MWSYNSRSNMPRRNNLQPATEYLWMSFIPAILWWAKMRVVLFTIILAKENIELWILPPRTTLQHHCCSLCNMSFRIHLRSYQVYLLLEYAMRNARSNLQLCHEQVWVPFHLPLWKSQTEEVRSLWVPSVLGLFKECMLDSDCWYQMPSILHLQQLYSKMRMPQW